MQILEQESQLDQPSVFDITVIDGVALVHMLPVKDATIFDEYASSVFLPHIMQQLEKCTRLDVVWDRYISNSLKAATREKRGNKGI